MLPLAVVAGSALSVAAGRISYIYGFKGPSVSIDTACSSSLVGTHMARISMAQGRCNTATTAGEAATEAKLKRLWALAWQAATCICTHGTTLPFVW